MQLGVCYYPEHWPQDMWADDAARMAQMGIKQVRIGEFAWSRIEPTSGVFDWAWLDLAIETLYGQGLEIVLGTPTATPPKWLVDADPSILAVDHHGDVRQFGSRRHYCFASLSYREQCARIVTALATRYGHHPAIKTWQTDNEYGCHDTIISYSNAARQGFRDWLAQKYGTIDALNIAWGNVFWSMIYLNFDEIDPPIQTVTEANPSHRQDWARFSSDQVMAFDRVQTDILRALSPGRDVLHNYMGMFTAFDHFDVGKALDVAAWDSYPLGFLEWAWWDQETKTRFMRQGHPDFTAFHHDLYRGVGKGRWQVIEQQPGPVNWGAWNPAPLPGMVRAWTWEAFAHGAETVSYFRWRQAPFAQEQMHAGLMRPDNVEAQGGAEARLVSRELEAVKSAKTCQSEVALIFDYQALWACDIQPQGRDYRGLEAHLAFYSAARRLGLSVDIISPDADLTGYKIVLCPLLIFATEDLVSRLKKSGADVILGPRSGSKTADFQIPAGLPPGPLADLIDVKVSRVESLRPTHKEAAGAYQVSRWLEHIDSPLKPHATTVQGYGIWYSNDHCDYIGCWPEPKLLHDVLLRRCAQKGLRTYALPDGLRLRQCGDVMFAINYENSPVELGTYIPDASQLDYLIGGHALQAADVAAWRLKE
jgi:beta-galactosidase